MWRLLSLAIFFICIYSSHGQQKTISGTIRNVEGGPVQFANIIVNHADNSAESITYGNSDMKGSFFLKIPEDIRKVILSITSVGYTEKLIEVQLDTVQTLDIYMEENVTLLEEVVVKVREPTDTLNLDIVNMNLNRGNTLRDILAKTDGVIVSEEGGISYQGKQIKKVLINDKEVFVDQNKVALDNLDYGIMENVQIINNYKDKFTLDFNRIRDPVINIKTKSEFRGVVKAQLDVGYGFKNKYSLKGKGFFFSDKLNVFATSNSNNAGQKELSQKDVSASVVEHASDQLGNTLSPFFIEDNQTKKNVVSNNSLTLRWQGKKSKSGLVFYHGNINIDRKTEFSTFVANGVVKESRQISKEKGSFVSATSSYSHLISPKTVVQNTLSVLGVKTQQLVGSLDTLFVPDTSFYGEQTQNRPNSLVLANALKLTHLSNDNLAFDIELDYYYENDSKILDTRLVNSDLGDIFQDEMFTKKYLSALSSFKYRLERNTLNLGASVTTNSESGKLNYTLNPENDIYLLRNVVTAHIPISLSGSIGKLDYLLSIDPTWIFFKKSEDREFFKMSHILTYTIEQQNKLILELSHDYRFFDLNSLYDTVVRSYNYKIINDRRNADQYLIKDELTFSWFNSNVARSKNMHFTYKFRRDKNFLESVLDSISDNVFYYSNRVFDVKYSQIFDGEAKKGFYLGEAYHLLDIGGSLNYTGSRYSTVINGLPARASVSSWKPAIKLGFLPRNFFIREFTNRTTWNPLLFKINGSKVTQQSVLSNLITIKGNRSKIDWKFDFDFRIYEIEQGRYSVPDCNLDFKYDFSENLAISLVGQSLLTLFRLNNFTFVNIISDGNTLTQITTDNNLGYLLLYTSFKF